MSSESECDCPICGSTMDYSDSRDMWVCHFCEFSDDDSSPDACPTGDRLLSQPMADILGPSLASKMDLNLAASRVASHSVEARRRNNSKKKTRSKGKPKRKTKTKSKRQEVEIQTSQAPIIEDDMLRSTTEYSCRMDLSISADFEGHIPKDRLIRKLKAEITASVRAAMGIVARDFGLDSTGVNIQPVRVECAMNDHG